MRPRWSRLPLPYCAHGCCCGLAEAQGLGLLVVGHPWGDGCSRPLDSLGFFGFAAPIVVDEGGLQGYGFLEVRLLQ